MNDHVSPSDLTKLSVAERLRLMEELWASLCVAPDKIDVPAWHRDELNHRLLDRDSYSATARSWAEVRGEILAGLRKG